jgi:CheY-like chemotaxis protein
VITPERQKETVAMASRQVGHMVRLLDDLLDVSRITHGKINMRNEEVDLGEVLKNAIDTASPFIQARRHTLNADLPPSPIWIKGDATRLAQLFGNLLNNAAKYTNANGKIALSLEAQDKNVKVSILDNGIGIEPDKQPYIFDMFMQVDNSMQRSQSGLGIGLTLVKNIATLHGGSMTVESEGKDKGTKFTVTLPLSMHTHLPVPQAEKAIAAPRLYRILVVDDNEAAAKTLGWMLEALDHSVQVVLSGKEALKVAPGYKPEVVLLDIGMPDMSGYELCGLLRQMKELQNTVFIAQTGWGQKQDLQRSKESGFAYHLIKPVRIETLQKQLESLHPSV